jgi:hypothetical protein
MKEIPLTQGKVALVDDEDYPHLSAFKWHLNAGYAARSHPWDGKRRRTFMHDQLLPAPPGFFTDHRNRNRLDNRRENLRISTRSQNAANRRLPRTNTSGFRGVHRSGRGWAATITCAGKHYYLGTFDTPEEAATAYDKKALELFGEFASLNKAL